MLRDMTKKKPKKLLSGTAFDFNDNLLPTAASFFVRLVEARLGCELYSAEELAASLSRSK